MFDVENLPKDTPVEWADAVNRGVAKLTARKVDIIPYDEPTHLRYCCRWVTIFLQAHIRRGLSLLESGNREIKNGRPLVAALCSRALLEDAAVIWDFNRTVFPLLEARDVDKIDALVFPKVFASRRPKDIELFGAEIKARNILTAIDKMTVEHPNIRAVYDQLSEVCHPNSLGVFSHFADTFDDKRAVFDDGQDMSDAAQFHLIFCGLMFVAEDAIIGRIETAIDANFT
ncbi:hypothetical protein JQ634_02265 [Bradyrhizobium sp. AUGA SZCCT0240]|uniref:hypothetical protein n=1 Tax=unclassified Bradyrhizobium TaxID=2631580 RepID=UPI001BA58189|nr:MULTISPECIES: hypothetical protein [unclassified Bradyrhizobium]MBR1196898.1 hypothetical protein [Bradyrhizobium sp. AUGA SZCCT0158]MBR1241878.1 hypothetical protein [Bradyrhizobium sp. AUGA SZCCT0274]MBR1252522.1 hypothetical protein [Bradyrhizobium sp. AUGA SZCCT0240]